MPGQEDPGEGVRWGMQECEKMAMSTSLGYQLLRAQVGMGPGCRLFVVRTPGVSGQR